MYSNLKVRNIFLVVASLILLATSVLPFKYGKVYAQEIFTETVTKNFNNQMICLAENVYFESGNQSFEGKLAVAQVTINRANSGKFPNDICQVVKQKTKNNTGKTICQFSWFCQPINPIKNKYQWEESLIVAKKALTEPVAHDLLHNVNALYFHADYVNPGWNLNRVAVIGRHIFYREK
jgi:spore germination cell wall hydrolase CwlJ-like protein